MDAITHEEITVNGLQKATYAYWFDPSKMKLVFAEYSEYSRLSKRHEWQCDGVWSRVNRKRDNTIDREDIPFLTEVSKTVLDKFIKQITVEN